MKDPRLNAALLRGMTQRRLSRRDLLRISGLSAATIAVAAACGVRGQGTPAPAPSDFWAGKTRNGTLRWANWAFYMDTESYPELTRFREETGIQWTYDEVIEDMGPWFAELQPQLAAGQDVGYDLMVITNGIQFRQFKQLGYLAPLDHTRLTNYAANVDPLYKQASYDPGNVFSVPYASGMTGIAYDPAKTGREITSLQDLWDPAFAGRIGMMADSQELANFGLLAIGVDPAASTPADWERAAQKLQEQKDLGVIRNYYDQDFTLALSTGEVDIIMAWSGDVTQLNAANGTNFQFVIPEEGGTIWTDNFAIPITAQNPVDALMAIDFFYDAEVAASLASYIGYVSPVPAAKEIMAGWAQDAAAEGDTESADWLNALVESPFSFPDSSILGRVHSYVDFETPALQQQFQDIFEPITLG